jgi:hypothetical protein
MLRAGRPVNRIPARFVVFRDPATNAETRWPIAGLPGNAGRAVEAAEPEHLPRCLIAEIPEVEAGFKAADAIMGDLPGVDFSWDGGESGFAGELGFPFGGPLDFDFFMG